mmetsp:Transcript_22411/g.53191  ORF Transcript_22411/g.53191 Transcript_22411/m.53191 type:complete len:281 (+) Transcript_22411:77-919(+)
MDMPGERSARSRVSLSGRESSASFSLSSRLAWSSVEELPKLDRLDTCTCPCALCQRAHGRARALGHCNHDPFGHCNHAEGCRLRARALRHWSHDPHGLGLLVRDRALVREEAARLVGEAAEPRRDKGRCRPVLGRDAEALLAARLYLAAGLRLLEVLDRAAAVDGALPVAAQAEGEEGTELGRALALAHPALHGLEPAAPPLAHAAAQHARHEVVDLREALLEHMVGVGEQQLPDLLARGKAVPAHDVVRAEVVEQPRHPRCAPRLARALRVTVHVRVLE